MLYLTVMTDFDELKNLIEPHKNPDKRFFLDLADADKQFSYESRRIDAVMKMLRVIRLGKLKEKLSAARNERDALTASSDYDAEKYRRVLELNADVSRLKSKMQEFKPLFEEPYFARMDVTDEREGYNSYYIGKRGDEKLEIVDWRAPLARRYYQKSKTFFSINDYAYKLILRRAIRTRNGRVLDFKNEYLKLSDYLSPEEIGGRNEELIFDPFLKEILKDRKEKREIRDIIETIQEKQFEIITLPERDEFALQGVAGSGKTMILLHRLSYVMYNNEKLRPSDVMVITPSDSFNAFIDELAQILELERVRTSTIDGYFLAVLKGAGADVGGKIDFSAPVNESYLRYIYSDDFSRELDKKLSKIYDGIYGLFASEDCRAAVAEVAASCAEQTELYEKIKNAGLRVRRCVLGEIKEKQGGGLYYTKQFRYLFNCVLDIKEFLSLVFTDERMKTPAYFYRQLLSFYKSLKYIRRYSEKICLSAIADLGSLGNSVKREINDLKRYKQRIGGEEILTYASGIEKREILLDEIVKTAERVESIRNGFFAVHDFADVLRGENYLVSVGKCENTLEVLRFFYRETVKRAKVKHGMGAKPLVRCDAYALCRILFRLGYDLSPKYAFVFVDEAQDISAGEYEILRAINGRAVFNVFGDLKQNITDYRGLRNWNELGLPQYELNLNYRNTNEIVEFVSRNLKIEMNSVGLDGEKTEIIAPRAVTSWLNSKNGLKAVICTGQTLENFSKKSYNLMGKTGRISKTRINVMTVYESKGLEFTAVAVVDGDMTDNEKYIAYTRALKCLALVRERQ